MQKSYLIPLRKMIIYSTKQQIGRKFCKFSIFST